jgi:hypothetical protein
MAVHVAAFTFVIWYSMARIGFYIALYFGCHSSISSKLIDAELMQ